METVTLKHTNKALQEYGEALMNLYKDKLKGSDRVASGDLINSVSVEVKSKGIDMQVELSLAEYWKYVEWDTRPHFPPFAPILRWVKVKPVIPRPYNGRLPTEEQLAYLVQRKIGLEGTKGSHDMRDAIDEINDIYLDKIEDAIAQDVSENAQIYLTLLKLD